MFASYIDEGKYRSKQCVLRPWEQSVLGSTLFDQDASMIFQQTTKAVFDRL